MLRDPYTPLEIAGRAAAAGVAKARLDVVSLFTLGVLAGAFIALGAQLATVAGVASGFGVGPSRLLIGVAFSLGLVLVVIAGAELFTGNMLILIARLQGAVTTAELARNWAIAYAGNFVGAVMTAGLVYASGQWTLAGGQVGGAALTTAHAKLSLSFVEAVARGILGNGLVCLAVWLCFGARTNADRILSIVFPIAGFVAAGFEHSIANMYFVPVALLIRHEPNAVAASGLAPDAVWSITWTRLFVDNLLPVTIGNVIGGAAMVAAVYWLIYLRPKGSLEWADIQAQRRQGARR
jgi:formate/nitrite transporter